MSILNVNIPASDEDISSVAFALASGAMPMLKMLSVSTYPREGVVDQGAVAVMNALSTGSCPMLQSLCLHCRMGAMATNALARAFSSGYCQHLQSLALIKTLLDQDPAGILGVVQAITKGVRPNLETLAMFSCDLNPEHCRVLGEALGVGAFPMLEDIDLHGNSLIGDEGSGYIIQGLEAGRYLNFQTLDLGCVGMGPIGAAALARCVESKSLQHLQNLSIDNQSVGDGPMAAVVRALASSCPKLMSLSASNTGMSEEAGHALLDALRDGAWPWLDSLAINDNLFPTNVLGANLAEALLGGKMPYLKDLSLIDCGLNEECANELAAGFARGACPRLASLGIESRWQVVFEGCLTSRGNEVVVDDEE